MVVLLVLLVGLVVHVVVVLFPVVSLRLAGNVSHGS